MNSLLEKYVDVFRSRRDLPVEEAGPLLDAMITATDEPLLAKLFEAWDRKGIAEDEIFGVAHVMRDRCTKIKTKHKKFVDIVGTGGSRSKTFNVSTAAAFVVAGTGLPVAKHGNRAATSSSGSADVLAELGVEPAVDAATAERCLDDIGICFMFAPNFHRLSPTLAKVRKGLGFPTIFNCVGPLCNPAGAPHQLIGVWDKDLTPKMANALARLGTKRSWIVHAEDGLDEISLAGPTFIGEVDGSNVNMLEIRPGDFGIAHSASSDSTAVSAPKSAEVIRGVLGGGFRDSDAESLVLINAAAALYLSGHGETLSGAYAIAVDSLKSGAAGKKLFQLARATQK
ncbi:MAG TPA: anthranilate phosphoribosyltransferase [Pyrinomonadaceae bacterium]